MLEKMDKFMQGKDSSIEDSHSAADGKIPKWLEDMTDNVRKNRPGSWKLSRGSPASKADSSDGPETLIETLQLDDSSLQDESVISPRGSARHGRRASACTTRSAGNSPFKGSSAVQTNVKELSLEESWNSLNFFNKQHKGRLNSKLNDGAVENLSPNAETEVHEPVESSDIDFIIPELPSGSNMVFNIHTTWGDRHYVGLNGIEVFSSSGEPVPIAKIWADPADINVLPEYSKDPRVVSNLLDGVNRTHDDMHLWLAPFTKGTNHFISLTFDHQVKVAMIRIWNYNKSRIHSYRGVRDVDITLDGVLIFRGEIARASGCIVGSTEAFGDTILFTTDDTILELISRYDESFSSLLTEDHPDTVLCQIDRPLTGDNGDERPFTCAQVQSSEAMEKTHVCVGTLLGGQKLELALLANWGHPSSIGLTGLEIVGDSGSVIHIEPENLQCNVLSPDIYSMIFGVTANLVSDGLQHTLTPRILDGVNMTTDANHMWQTSFHEGDSVVLTISFPFLVYIAGLRVWNYNGASDLSYCGVKFVTLHLDGRLIYPGLLTLRRAPGNCHYNFVQDITLEQHGSMSYYPEYFIQSPYSNDREDAKSREVDYESPGMPQGFVFQLMIWSTWGDPYYVGLNGLELFDQNGDKIRLTENNIGAYPDSVNILEGVSNDVRTPEKLVDGVNDTFDGRHMWLAPILPNQLNRIYIVFDYPVIVSMLKLWNYAKTPIRGVKEFGVLVDDLLVYSGMLDKVQSNKHSAAHVRDQTVMFTSDSQLLKHSTQVRNSNVGHDIQLMNNQQRVTSGGSCLSADQSQRPLTSLSSNKQLHKH